MASGSKTQSEMHVTVTDLGAAVIRGQVKLADLTGHVTQTLTTRSTESGKNTLRNMRSAHGQDGNLSSSRTFDTPTSMFGLSGNRTEASSSSASAQRKKKRDSNPTREETAFDAVDSAAERIFVNMFEQPIWLESCMHYPALQRYCFPAEYATRHQRVTVDGGKRERVGDSGTMFGLVDVKKCGYWLTDPGEVAWADDLIPNRLGLQLAIHRRTSHKRLCLQQHKANMPPGVGTDQMKMLLRGLKRCDHVNCLQCFDVYEDATKLYFMYEYYPCITLQTALAKMLPMNQEQLVNIARECAAATAFASSVGLCHLGWTLAHVLLPESAVDGDLHVSKVFGFGLMGVVQTDSHDRLCWSPEALDKSRQASEGDNFVARLDGATRPASDSWSLGTIIYALVARNLPCATEDDVLAKRWTFTLHFDEMDREAKSLVDALLHPNHDRRMRAERVLHAEWVRRRWRPPSGHEHIFHKVEEFCSAPLAKRLFGRFLVRFLEAQHLRRIANRFYAMDSGGKGALTLKELQYQAKQASRPTSVAQTIFDWLRVENAQHISLLRFAESMAEEVADGPALRIAFESLDEDGSEEVTTEELWEVLRSLDPSLTVEDVKAHIKNVEDAMDGWTQSRSRKFSKQSSASGQHGGQHAAEPGEDHERDEEKQQNDGAIDYNEFMNLFPVRMHRLKLLETRISSCMESGMDAAARFASIQQSCSTWVKALESECKSIDALADATAHKTEESDAAAGNMKKHFVKVVDLLCKVPGKAVGKDDVPVEDRDLFELKSKTMVSAKRRKFSCATDEWGFDTFLLQEATKEAWSTLIHQEHKNLKAALQSKGRVTDSVDVLKAHDAANAVVDKVTDVLMWTKATIQEYEAYAEAYEHPEVLLPDLPSSARSLRNHGANMDGENDGCIAGTDDGPSDSSGNIIMRLFAEATARIFGS